jgi:thiol-disulfide isomerase/thioredoxin
MLILPIALLAPALGGCDRAKPDAHQATPADVTATDAVPAETVGVVDITHRGGEAPAMPFEAPGGAPATLASFRGKPLLVNLWATWCAPCVKEMPALDKLAQAEASRFRVVTISQDMGGARDVAPFFAKKGFKALPQYLDKQNVLMEALKIDTLPTTIFYDAQGREQWRVVGAMDWSGKRARTLIDGALGPAGKQS